MEERIQELSRKLKDIAAFYAIYQERNNIEQIKEIIPQIQEFVLWFLEENKFGIEPELYQGMSNDLLSILEDILEALNQRDLVLMHDATAYGLLEYLKLFVDTEQEENADDNL